MESTALPALVIMRRRSRHLQLAGLFGIAIAPPPCWRWPA
jgi:Na+/H+-translocating membrane pyrophosphatase